MKVGAEGAYYPLFSRVEVQHRALPVGLSHSTVKEVKWWGGLLKTITLDGYVDFPQGKRCGVLIHCIDNKGHGICAVEVAGVGKTDTLKVISKVRQSADSIPHSGDVLSFGILDTDGGFQAVTRTMKIVNIEPADHGYSLTLKDYNPALYEYGTLPEYKSNITYIPDSNPKPHTSDKGYVTRDELKKVNEQAVKQAALEAAAKAAQAAIDVIARGDTFSDAFQLNGYGTSLENLIDKMDEDARNAKDGLSITKDEILLKVSDTEEGLQSFIGITKDEILAKADDMRRELTALLNIQAGAIHALVKGGGATGQMALTLNLPVMIDDATREKLIKASSLEKVNAVYAKVKDTDYYGIKPDAGAAIKPLWEDARRAALLASQISLEADQIQFKSDNIFVNGKLKADYINTLELVVQKLHIDSNQNSNKDFEAWFDEINGLKIKNNGKEIFKIDREGYIDAVCFNISLKKTYIKDTYRSTSAPISQDDLMQNEKMFYDGLEVEKVTVSHKTHNKVEGVLLCHDIQSNGSRVFFSVSTFFYNMLETVYTIHYKNGTRCENIKKEYTLDKYGEEFHEKNVIIGGINDLPYPFYDTYPKTKSSGGSAPGSIVVKNSTVNERRLFSFKNLPRDSDDMSEFPAGTIYVKNNALYIL